MTRLVRSAACGPCARGPRHSGSIAGESGRATQRRCRPVGSAISASRKSTWRTAESTRSRDLFNERGVRHQWSRPSGELRTLARRFCVLATLSTTIELALAEDDLRAHPARRRRRPESWWAAGASRAASRTLGPRPTQVPAHLERHACSSRQATLPRVTRELPAALSCGPRRAEGVDREAARGPGVTEAGCPPPSCRYVVGVGRHPSA